MEDKDVTAFKHHLDETELSSFEKMTLCKILGDWYSQLYSAEYLANLAKATWERIIK